MSEPVIKVFDTPAQAAAACAGVVAEALAAAEAENRLCSLCLSGGSTPKAVFFLLAKEEGLPWSRAEFYWGDERYVGPEHKDSNFRAAHELLIKPLGIGEASVHPIPTAAGDPAADARRYETALRARWPKAPAPAFDVLLLGLGPDGHTASLFPGVAALDEEERWVAAVHRPAGHGPGAAADDAPRWRVTLTPPALAGARATVFLAVGEDKAEAVERVLRGSGPDEDCPARLVQPQGAPALWLLDAAAAKRLG
ncbi:MAG: 6-phosphogluconolactonase [Elusimicrobia bacterium]|nr:6-phosphogluconolactonase [Elusimicrobiota bacterium]